MLARKRIRSQLYFAVTMIVVIVGVLSTASIQGSLKFRKLTKSIRGRTMELPLASALAHKVSDLRSYVWAIKETDRACNIESTLANSSFSDPPFSPFQVSSRLSAVEAALAEYRQRLESIKSSNLLFEENAKELHCIDNIENRLKQLERHLQRKLWAFHGSEIQPLRDKVDELQAETGKLPSFMKERMEQFAEDARLQYHTWMLFTAILTTLAFVFIFLLYYRFNKRVFQPLDTLVEGSRVVAGGNFDFRISLKTNDEVAELADALNAMTENFQAVSKDLNNQVQQRTKEVVRSEKMASVGFLAAGVAHEINNPLATIAWSAESLESRIHDILAVDDQAIDPGEREYEIAEMKKYLRRIQDEAFRCKGITSGLLDFSRMGDVKKAPANLNELVESVVEMVRPLSKYREKNILFNPNPAIYALINEQEIKQVVLNLITNALDSVDAGGTVRIDLEQNLDHAILRVVDDGCGMTSEVIKQLFEPFFTRRRDGQGTGLGLSITYQIIEDHGGKIAPYSDGPGKGSSFTVNLPLVKNEKIQFARAA